MNYYALLYELVEDMVTRRIPFREEHLRLAREALVYLSLSIHREEHERRKKLPSERIAAITLDNIPEPN